MVSVRRAGPEALSYPVFRDAASRDTVRVPANPQAARPVAPERR